MKPQQTILVHAAAGGVGGLIVQMAKLMGATVLGTVSTPEKAQVARSNGADQVILYHQNDFETEVMDFTNGIGVDVVYDSVGVDTFHKSLNLLKNCGMLVLFGQSSGLT
ncbi:MAG: zinc-binding dehydrogenase, partial [Dolichospermum sp.]